MAAQAAMVLLERGAELEVLNLEGRSAAGVAAWCNRSCNLTEKSFNREKSDNDAYYTA